MKIRYENRNFKPDTLFIIEQATVICEEYQGVSLTLRQLYYQFVARGLLENNQKNYDRLGDIINNARMAGKFDWDFIVDRTRNLQKLPNWHSPAQMISEAAEQFRMDLWAPQKRRIEVWIEKDAAVGVIERICDLNDVPFFSCRGYTSTSEMWNAANRIGEYLRNGEQTLILHIGDHDPSGLHMTKDIEKRLRTFISNDWANEHMGFGSHDRGSIRRSQLDYMMDKGCNPISDYPWQVKRIALTMEQIQRYEPPANYAKQSDSRYEDYVAETGVTDSWELDALDPFVMENLIQDEIDEFRDDAKYHEVLTEQEENRKILLAVSENWDTIRKVHTPSKAEAK